MTKRKGGLGRGLDSLLNPMGGPPANEPQTGLRMVAPSAIIPNPHQPRSEFDEEQLQELAASIREHGLIQPLIVTQDEEQYVLIAGERRWRASQLAGISEIPVVLKEATPQEMLELAIIENVQRADLNVLEEAIAYKQLMDEFNLTQEQVADRMGKARTTVTNIVRLLKLPQGIQKLVLDGRLSGRHAREILRLENDDDKFLVARSVVRLEHSVRKTKQLVDQKLAGKKSGAKPAKRLPPELAALKQEIEKALETRVDLSHTEKGGKVVIHFYSDEDLNRIYDKITGEDAY